MKEGGNNSKFLKLYKILSGPYDTVNISFIVFPIIRLKVKTLLHSVGSIFESLLPIRSWYLSIELVKGYNSFFWR